MYVWTVDAWQARGHWYRGVVSAVNFVQRGRAGDRADMDGAGAEDGDEEVEDVDGHDHDSVRSAPGNDVVTYDIRCVM